MDVILHLGAHRTGTTSFQDYMRRHATLLESQGVGFWGPRQTRRGLFAGLWPRGDSTDTQDAVTHAKARVQARLDQARQTGVKKLVISDANMIGSVRDNLEQAVLYPDATNRLTRFADAFEGQVSTVLFSPRSLELYWCSAVADGVSRGATVPSRDELHDIATSKRGWRDVISDIAAAFPKATLNVVPSDRFAGQPAAMLLHGADIIAPVDQARVCLNRQPTLPELRRTVSGRGGATTDLPFGMGRWNPFTNEEHAALREMYADDMMWLTAGAAGLAKLTEDRCHDRAGQTPPGAAQSKGRCDELEERQVARPG